MARGNVDPRFSLANERTFLAWIRTSLGMLAAAAGLTAVDLPWPDVAVRALAALLAAVAGLTAYLAWHRWRNVEDAIAEGRPTPPPRVHRVLSLAVGLAAVAVVVLIVL